MKLYRLTTKSGWQLYENVEPKPEMKRCSMCHGAVSESPCVYCNGTGIETEQTKTKPYIECPTCHASMVNITETLNPQKNNERYPRGTKVSVYFKDQIYTDGKIIQNNPNYWVKFGNGDYNEFFWGDEGLPAYNVNRGSITAKNYIIGIIQEPEPYESPEQKQKQSQIGDAICGTIHPAPSVDWKSPDAPKSEMQNTVDKVASLIEPEPQTDLSVSDEPQAVNPYEVRVSITLEGTVRAGINESCFELSTPNGGWATIGKDEVSADDLQLVESLLKAQGEG